MHLLLSDSTGGQLATALSISSAFHRHGKVQFFGSVCADYEPNQAASTLLGMMSDSTKGDGQKLPRISVHLRVFAVFLRVFPVCFKKSSR